MQGKPDTVESTDDVAVQVGEFIEYFSQDDLSPLVGKVVSNVPSGRICNGKMYTATDANFNKFNVTDLETKITSLSSVQMPTTWQFPAWCVVGNKMYFFGGMPQQSANTSTVRIYDTETDMWTTHPFPGSYSGTSGATRGSTAFYNSTIYVFGSASSSGNSATVYTFNIETYETSTKVFTSSISPTIYSGNSSVQMFVNGKYAYLVLNPASSVSGIRFDLEDYTYEPFPFTSSFPTSDSDYKNFEYRYSNSLEVENERYLFGFNSNSSSAMYYPALIKVTIGETSGTLDLVFNYTHQNVRINFIAGVTQNNMYAIEVSSVDTSRKGWKAPYQYPLENGKLLLQEGSKSFRIINSKDAKISFKIKDAFLGQETGYADEVDAYLYDTTQQKWISLDGTPFGSVTPEPTPTLEGTWVLNETLVEPENWSRENVEFTATNTAGTTASFTNVNISETTSSGKSLRLGSYTIIYWFSTNSWSTGQANDKYNKWTFPAGATASDEFRAWLAANAAKQ